MRNVCLVILLSITANVFAQKSTKEFLGKDLKQCDSSVAVYYRIINYNNYSKPLGHVKEYYLNGELEWEGQFFKYNKTNPAENRYQGECTWYYPNGKKKKSAFYHKGQGEGPCKAWFENGNLDYQLTFKRGKLQGLFLQWYENGLLKNYAVFDNGKVVGKESIFCNKFGECTCIDQFKFCVPNGFIKKEYSDYSIGYIIGGNETNYYSYSYDSRFESYSDVNIFNKKIDSLGMMTQVDNNLGLLVKSRKNAGFKVFFTPLNYSRYFKIEMDFLHMKQKSDKKSGLIFAFKDSINYQFFIVDVEGNYEIGNINNGIREIIANGKISGSYYNSNKTRKKNNFNYYKKKNPKSDNINLYEIVISCNKDTLKFMNKNTTLYKKYAADLDGDYIGFYIGSKEGIQVTELIIKTEVDAPFLSADIDSKKIEKPWRSTGSGFIVSSEGYLITNFHVIDNATEIEIDVVRNGNWVTYKCEIIITDEKSDLAVLKIKDTTFVNYDAIPFIIQTNLARVGSNVYALGYPYALSALGNELKFTEGTVNARTGFKGELLAYQISVPVQPGNSGGPLFDMDGNVIGVVNSKLFNADNVAFAVKANYIINLLQMLPSEISLCKKPTLMGKSPAEQVDLLREYVPLIKVR